MSSTTHFGRFHDEEVVTIEEFAARTQTSVKTAERVLERMGVPVQSPARGMHFVSCYHFRLAIERGGFERWTRAEDPESVSSETQGESTSN